MASQARTSGNADRLELAAIGTVHSVAHRILSRYAIHLGLSTRLEVMTEEAANRLVSHQLSELPEASWKALAECAGRFGIDDTASIVLTLLNAKRGNQIGDDLLRSQLNASASRVCELMAPQGNVQSSNFDDLLTMIGACLSSGPVQTCTTNDSRDARQKLQDLQSLRMANGALMPRHLV